MRLSDSGLFIANDSGTCMTAVEVWAEVNRLREVVRELHDLVEMQNCDVIAALLAAREVLR